MDETMTSTWKGFATSIPGSGHIRLDIPCQDASLVIIAERPAMIVCDGRGSATHSHFGSQAAVKIFRTQVAILEPMIGSILDREDASEDNWRNFCRIMYRTLAQVKLDLADEYHLPEKEFDFTVAFAITGKSFIGCFQVGDGAIVLRQNETCETAFLPEKGEFANQTTFLRSGGDSCGKFQSRLFDVSENSGIAITSDGPEHLMFKLPEMIPGKVFDAMFDDLSGDKLNRQDILNYLTDRRWDDDPRGTDDRSLAIIAKSKNAKLPKTDKTENVCTESCLGYEIGDNQIPAHFEFASQAENNDNCPEDANDPPISGKQNKTVLLPCGIAALIAVSGYCIWAGYMMLKATQNNVKHQEQTLYSQQSQLKTLRHQSDNHEILLQKMNSCNCKAETFSEAKDKFTSGVGEIPTNSTDSEKHEN